MRPNARRRLIVAEAPGTFAGPSAGESMVRFARWGVLGAALSVAACSRAPNPVVAHDPIPQPPPGYAVRCSATPFIFNGYLATCTPGIRPVEERTVVRAKG